MINSKMKNTIKNRQGQDSDSFDFWLNFGFVSILIIGFGVGGYFLVDKIRNFGSSYQKIVDNAKIEYFDAAVIGKTFDTRTKTPALTFIDSKGDVDAIKQEDLWRSAEKGDSIRIGVKMVKHSPIYMSIKVVGKSKGKYNIDLFASPEPAQITHPVIIRR